MTTSKIPKGYEVADESYQCFGSFKVAFEFIKNYCKICKISKDCKAYEVLGHAIGNNYPIWDEDYFVKITPKGEFSIGFSLEDKVHCKKFVDPQSSLEEFPEPTSTPSQS